MDTKHRPTDDRKEQDEKYNPGQEKWDQFVDSHYSKDEKQQLSDLADKEESVKETTSGKSAKAPKQLSEEEWKTDMSRSSGNIKSGLANFWSNPRNKTLIGTFGIGGFGLLSLFFFLFNLKLPSISDLLTDEAGQRVEHVMVTRVEKVMLRAMFDRFGNDFDGNVIATGSPLADLYATMRTNRFEQQVEKKYGLKIEKKNGQVRLIKSGKFMGTASTPDELGKLMQKDSLTRRDMRKLVNEEVPAWRVFKRMKFARWLRYKYGIRLKIPNSTAEKEEDRTKEMWRDRLKIGFEQKTASLTGALGCFLGSDCPVDNNHGVDTPEQHQILDGDQSAVGNVQEIADQAVEQSLESTGSTDSKNFFADILTKQFAMKAIPVIGWIDMVATLDHIFWEVKDNKYLVTIPAHFKKVSYAQQFGEWAVSADQTRDSKLDPGYVGFLSTRLDGMESSRAFEYINGNPDRGEEMTADEKINETETNAAQTAVDVIGKINIGNNIIGHTVLNIYYETLGGGGLLGWLGDKFGDIFTSIASFLTPAWVEEWLAGLLEKMSVRILEYLGWAADPMAVGSKLFNGLHAGATVSFDTNCAEELGCRKLTNAEANEIKVGVTAEQQSQFAERPLHERLFATDTHRSAISQLALSSPSTNELTGGSVTQLASFMGSIVQNGYSSLFQSANARDWTYRNLYNSYPWGATAKETSVNLNKAVFDGEECPETDPETRKSLDTCISDKKAVEVVSCSLGVCQDEYGGMAGSSGGGSEFLIGTFNVLGSSHTRDGTPGTVRIQRAIDLVKRENVDVFGVQELESDQRRVFMEKAGGQYDIHPSPADYSKQFSKNSVIWRKDRFVKVSAGRYDIPYFNGNPASMAWVKLRDKETSQTFYVANTHDPASTRGPAEAYRKEAAEIHLRKMTEFTKDGSPAFMVGDFNSSFEGRALNNVRANLTYCILTSTGLMRHAEDVLKNNTGTCPQKNGGGIDHVYVSKEVEVSSYKRIENNASDHPLVYAGIQIPGGGEASSEGFGWPISKQNWPKQSQPIAECGLRYSDGTVHTGIDISVPTGTPVLAAADGKVVYSSSSYGMLTLETKGANGNTIYVNYQHLSVRSAGMNKQVKRGDVIGRSGSVGTSSPHLHFAFWKVIGPLSGHMSPTSPQGKQTVSNMLNPYDYMPKDGRNVHECN